jgi:hypothetical protein
VYDDSLSTHTPWTRTSTRSVTCARVLYYHFSVFFYFGSRHHTRGVIFGFASANAFAMDSACATFAAIAPTNRFRPSSKWPSCFEHVTTPTTAANGNKKVG